MIRVWLAVGAGLGCGWIGMRRAAAYRTRARELRLWVDALRRLALLLAERGSTLPEAIEACACAGGSVQAGLREAARLLRQQPGLSPQEAFQQGGMRHLTWATAEERTEITHMLTGLGKGTLAMRCQTVEQTAARLTLSLEQAEASREKDGKLAMTLGWAAGVSLTILLL